MDEIAGILGLALLSLSWISEAYSTIKAGYAKIPLQFALLYFAASLLLAYHAYTLNDNVFLLLNVVTSLIALLNILYIFAKPQKKTKNKK